MHQILDPSSCSEIENTGIIIHYTTLLTSTSTKEGTGNRNKQHIRLLAYGANDQTPKYILQSLQLK